MKLKEEFQNSKIYVPYMNSNMIGKFIPVGVLEKMSEKYPELFERVVSPDPSMEVSFEEALEAKLEFVEKKKLEEDEEIN